MPGQRTRARAYVLQVLYASDLGGESDEARAMTDLRKDDEFRLERDGDEYASALLEMVRSHAAGIDEVIQGASRNWRLDRMATVDRNILRLAAGELIHIDSVPTKVIINEAIELAKKYGTAESAAFVNGILDRIAKSNPDKKVD